MDIYIQILLTFLDAYPHFSYVLVEGKEKGVEGRQWGWRWGRFNEFCLEAFLGDKRKRFEGNRTNVRYPFKPLIFNSPNWRNLKGEWKGVIPLIKKKKKKSIIPF